MPPPFEARLISRRHLLGAGVGATGILLSDCAEPPSHEAIVAEEAKKFSFTLEQISKEQLLWAQGYKPITPPVVITQQNFPQIERLVRQRTITTLSLMTRSENSVISNTWIEAQPLFTSQELRIKVIGVLRDDKGRELSMHIVPVAENGRIVFELRVGANSVMNRLSSLTQAYDLSHEITHVKDIKEYFASLPPSFTPQQKIDVWNEKMRQREELAKEEAKAYATEAEAYIRGVGLGDKSEKGLSRERYTAKYIVTGRSADSKEWISFIREQQTTP